MNENQVQLINIVAYGISRKSKINAKLDERIQIVETEDSPVFRLLSAPCGCKQWHELQNNIWYSCRALEKCSEHISIESFAYMIINRIPTIMFGVEMDDETGKPKYDRPKKAEVAQKEPRTKTTSGIKEKTKVPSAPMVLNPTTVPTGKVEIVPAPAALPVSAQDNVKKTKVICTNKIEVNEIAHSDLLEYVSKETKFHAPTALNRKNEAGEMMFVVRFKVSEEKIHQIGDSYIYLYGAPYSKVLEMSKAVAREITKMMATS